MVATSWCPRARATINTTRAMPASTARPTSAALASARRYDGIRADSCRPPPHLLRIAAANPAAKTAPAAKGARASGTEADAVAERVASTVANTAYTVTPAPITRQRVAESGSAPRRAADLPTAYDSHPTPAVRVSGGSHNQPAAVSKGTRWIDSQP